MNNNDLICYKNLHVLQYDFRLMRQYLASAIIYHTCGYIILVRRQHLTMMHNLFALYIRYCANGFVKTNEDRHCLVKQVSKPLQSLATYQRPEKAKLHVIEMKHLLQQITPNHGHSLLFSASRNTANSSRLPQRVSKLLSQLSETSTEQYNCERDGKIFNFSLLAQRREVFSYVRDVILFVFRRNKNKFF